MIGRLTAAAADSPALSRKPLGRITWFISVAAVALTTATALGAEGASLGVDLQSNAPMKLVLFSIG
jgi:hypothetical protein